MKKKIKILFAINCMNIGGAPTVVYEQIKDINKEKFKPYLLTLYPSKKANFFNKINFLPRDNIVQFKLKNRSIFDIKTLLQIYKFLRKEKFDIVYTHLFLANFIVRSLAILAKVPRIIIFEHSFYYNKSRWQIFADRILAKFTDKIIAPSRAITEFTSRQEKIALSKFSVIPNSIILPNKGMIDGSNLRKEAGISKNAFIVVSLGRFSEEKGQIFFIEAAEIVKKECPEICFILVGHGYLEESLRKIIEEKDMSGYFKLLSLPEKAKEYLYVGEIFVLSSVREGQPIVLLEAMMVGLPIIATSIDGTKGTINDNVNGLLVSPRSGRAIADKIIYLYNNSNIREELGKSAYKSVQGVKAGANIRKLENEIESCL